MRATSGVDVMVAGPPAAFGRIDPAFDFEIPGAIFGVHGQGARLQNRFGSAGKSDGVISVGQKEAFTVGAIDLRMESEIGREALGLAGIDAALGVANFKACGGG